jgi:hypothetical protein
VRAHKLQNRKFSKHIVKEEPRGAASAHIVSIVVFGILQCADHRFGSETVANGIAAGLLFALFRGRVGAFASIIPVGLPLPEGSHCEPVAIIGFVLLFGLVC